MNAAINAMNRYLIDNTDETSNTTQHEEKNVFTKCCNVNVYYAFTNFHTIPQSMLHVHCTLFLIGITISSPIIIITIFIIIIIIIMLLALLRRFRLSTYKHTYDVNEAGWRIYLHLHIRPQCKYYKWSCLCRSQLTWYSCICLN